MEELTEEDEEFLQKFNQEFISKQVPLEPEFERILYENLEELYYYSQ